MTPEEKARVIIDRQLEDAGWLVVDRDEYTTSAHACAVREGLMNFSGTNLEADYLLFIEGKAVGVVEAKREENELGDDVVAQELRAHGYDKLFYYDNKKHGEVDFLIDNYQTLSVLPIEVKSGKDYYVHSALTHFVSTPDYHILEAIVLSNEPDVKQDGKIIYMPIYDVMFLQKAIEEEIILPL